MRASTLILLIAVVALGLYIRFYERHQDATDRKREIARRVLRINPTRINTLRVTQPDLQFTAERRDREWRLTSPVNARADAGAIARIIDAIELLERSDLIRGREWRKKGMTLADFGLEVPRARITLASTEKEWTLLIGRDTAAGGNLYLKEAHDSSVFIVSTNLLSDLPTSLNALRDRRVFLGFPGEVTRIDLRRREGLLSLARTEVGNWRIQQPWTGRAAGAGVQDLLDQLFTARIADFIAESFDAAPLYGLDEPAAQAAVTGDRRYGEQVLLIGKPVAGDTNLVYATRVGEGTVFAIPRSVLDLLQTRAEPLRDRRVLTLPAYDIARMRVEEGERALELARDEAGGWEIREPIRAKANDARIQNVLAEWTGLRIESFADPGETNLVALGFNPPLRQITFSRRPAGAAEDDAVIQFSTLTPSNDLILARLAHENVVIRLRADTADSIPLSALAFRHLEAIQVDAANVRTLSIIRNGREESVLRDTVTNEFRAGTPGMVIDADHVRAVIDTLAALRATAYVAPAEDASAFGLDAPAAQLTVGIQGGLAPVRTLLIGRETEEGVHAMLRGGDAVFLIPHATRDKLLLPLYKSSRTTKEPSVAPAPAPSISAEPAHSAP